MNITKSHSLLIFFLPFNLAIAQSDAYNSAVKNITNAIVHDIFSAPAASRIYAYSTIAGYEAMQYGDEKYPSFYGKLNQFPEMPVPEKDADINFEIAGIFALYYTARAFLFSEEQMDFFVAALRLKNVLIFPEKTNTDSENYGHAIAEKILSWAATDGYKESRSLPRYTLIANDGAWQPTPPDYADAVEPYWGTLRTFILDSAEQFAPPACTLFSTDTNSLFYKMAFDVYSTGKQLTEEQQMIARFWDDNPFSSKYIGHMQIAEKKISPTGHWLDITRVAIEISKSDLLRSAQIYATVSIACADAFIACWAEKYKSNIIRPETYINKYIDAQWKPFLQTPAFPEYTSGHSTISAAAAIVATYYFGDQFSFTDASETIYDLPARTFSSFQEAAHEVNMSRYYGGIHFKQSLEAGSSQGSEIGSHIVHKLMKD